MSDSAAEQDRDAREAHEASEISYDEQRYPARPKRLRPRARLRGIFPRRQGRTTGKADGNNEAYVSWLTQQSMLADAVEFAKQFSGQGSMWQNPFANPDPRAAIEKASVWFTAYPISMITKPGTSFLGTLGDDDLWAAFEADRHRRRAHRTGQEGRRYRRLGADTECRRALRPDQHPPRRGVRHRGGVPVHVRGRGRSPGHGHRRHRARTHRQGRRLPAGRDEGR